MFFYSFNEDGEGPSPPLPPREGDLSRSKHGAGCVCVTCVCGNAPVVVGGGGGVPPPSTPPPPSHFGGGAQVVLPPLGRRVWKSGQDETRVRGFNVCCLFSFS